ncbi:sensor domain-containing diguanylate cyclase [Desulfocurvus sp.]|jgi:diguanylate cyclase (GGDEF)-like protein/PAS domain S-box-containing protein|uniref:sensor domain-containing diguanylate cyclase n=1 Tax=Desulfocurvus sp. TaxID=2871698 RepID=UPI0025BA4C5A|nr:sensor domain-containing diguanylate cyclase [Desulfocurvus sp.]MCK9239458.1 sensor domain-containing diguanylate cyclase [Desulfocurvus sp.]
MVDTLLVPADTALLLGAVSRFLLASVCLCAGRNSLRRLPLHWLAWFGFLGGAACCMELWAYSSAESAVAVALRSALYIGAMVCLVEFWAAMHARAGGRRGQGVWFFLALLAVYAGALALGDENPLRVAGGLFGVASGGAATWALLRAALSESRGRWLLLAAALALLVAALGGGVGAHGLALRPVAQALDARGGGTGLVVWALLGATGSTALALALWLYGVALSERLLRQRLRWAVGFLPPLALVLAAGSVGADHAGREHDARMRQDLLVHVRIAAGALDQRLVLALAQGVGGPDDPGVRDLVRTLEGAVQADEGLVSACLYVPRGDGTAVLAAAPQDGQGRPAGRMPWPAGQEALMRYFFASGRDVVAAPLHDHWGTFAVAHHAVARVPGGGRVLAALALESDARGWGLAVAGQRLLVLRQALLGSALLLAFFVALQVFQAQTRRTEESERKYRSLFQSMQEGVAYCRVVSDAEGRARDFVFLDVNPAAETLTGIPRERYLGRSVLELFPDQREKLYRWIDFLGTVARTQHTRSGEMFFAPTQLWFSVRAFSWEQGYFAMTVNDITRRRLVEEEQRRQALHDPLTDLPNRRLFQDRLEQALAQVDRSGGCCAVFYMDLNDFKQVNDTLGHEFGDAVLREVAARLRRCVRKSDTLARIGGDEFTAVISCGEDPGTVGTVAAKMQAALAEPVRVGDVDVRLGVSIGVSLYPHHGADAATVLTRADAAMYRGKGDRSVAFVLYEEERPAG